MCIAASSYITLGAASKPPPFLACLARPYCYHHDRSFVHSCFFNFHHIHPLQMFAISAVDFSSIENTHCSLFVRLFFLVDPVATIQCKGSPLHICGSPEVWPRHSIRPQ